MASFHGPTYLAAVGTTSNNTHPGVRTHGDYDLAIFHFIVEAVGATPTVTWKIQGCWAEPDVIDADALWFDLGYVTESSDTFTTATRVATATTDRQANFAARPFSRFRLITSSNTNVTYRCEMQLVRGMP